MYIGDNVMIGPNTLITTVGHPLTPMGRRKHIGIATPVHIGNDVWIGKTLGPGTVKFLLNYSKLEFMVPGPNVASVVAQPNFFSQIKLHIKPSQSNCSRQDP